MSFCNPWSGRRPVAIRSFWLLAATVFCAGWVCAAPAAAQDDPYREDLNAAQRYADTGKRARARSIYEEILLDADEFGVGGEGPGLPVVRSARVGLLQLDLLEGRYAEVRATIAALPAELANDAGMQLIDARAATRLGDYEGAIAIYERHLAADPTAPGARYLLGEVAAEIGRDELAEQAWTALVDASRRDAEQDPMTLTWIARAHIARHSRTDYERASSLLVDAIRRAPELPDPRIELGWLRFLAYGEAARFESGESLLNKVLQDIGEDEEALLRLYRIRDANPQLDGGKTRELLDRALAVNPNSVAALRHQGIKALDERRFEDGAKLLDRALAINPRDKRTLAQRAAAAFLQGESAEVEKYRGLALAVDAGFAGVDQAIGDRLLGNYRFADATLHLERALAQDPDDVDVLHGLAKASVYTGQGERARELLLRAAELQDGMVHPWRNNILAIEELLADEYERIERGGFVFRLHRDDRAVLEEYLIPFQLEARKVLGEKYGYEPPFPVTVEVLHTWDDFSVRTIGFRGFTALGACFGPLITLVAPADADLRKNDFMWTATVWHEYAHVLTLGLSDSRVPRWLTEGFSVYEESAKNPAWERGMIRDLLDAYHNRQIPPVHLLNRLFGGARILFGYYQGGLIVEFLAREHGFDKVVEMLRLYAEDLSVSEVFERAFGFDTREFDQRFLRYVADEKLAGLQIVPRWDQGAVQRKYDELARDGTSLRLHLDLAWAMLQRDVAVDAAEHLRQALALEPDSAEAQLVHAELLRRRDRLDEAVQAYERGFDNGADDFESRIRFGKLLHDRGDLDGAARQYQAAKRCWPDCTDQNVAPPVLLALLYREQGKRTEAMMELKSFCRLTARAFQPRLTLAEWARESGDRASEAKLLEEAVQIDPFMRSVHLRLADALLELGREQEAARELRVALSVDPRMDREFVGAQNQPNPDSPEFRQSQAEVCVRLARLYRQFGDDAAARRYLERAEREAPTSEAAEQARQLRDEWR